MLNTSCDTFLGFLSSLFLEFFRYRRDEWNMIPCCFHWIIRNCFNVWLGFFLFVIMFNVISKSDHPYTTHICSRISSSFAPSHSTVHIEKIYPIISKVSREKEEKVTKKTTKVRSKEWVRPPTPYLSLLNSWPPARHICLTQGPAANWII